MPGGRDRRAQASFHLFNHSKTGDYADASKSGKRRRLQLRIDYLILTGSFGEMTEWLKVRAWKARVGAISPAVRISISPLYFLPETVKKRARHPEKRSSAGSSTQGAQPYRPLPCLITKHLTVSKISTLLVNYGWGFSKNLGSFVSETIFRGSQV